jgi:ATP-binding cassette subfamily C (CFTR/MRP) protein 1
MDLLRASDGYFASLQLKSPSDLGWTEISSSEEEPSHPANNVDVTAAEALAEEAQDLKRQNSDFSVYSYYIRAGGHRTVATMLVMMALLVFCNEFPGKFAWYLTLVLGSTGMLTLTTRSRRYRLVVCL